MFDEFDFVFGHVKSGCGFGRVFGGVSLGLELPLEDAGPVLGALFIKFVFPFGFRVLAIFAIVIALVASGAVSALHVVVELTLRL